MGIEETTQCLGCKSEKQSRARTTHFASSPGEKNNLKERRRWIAVVLPLLFAPFFFLRLMSVVDIVASNV